MDKTNENPYKYVKSNTADTTEAKWQKKNAAPAKTDFVKTLEQACIGTNSKVTYEVTMSHSHGGKMYQCLGHLNNVYVADEENYHTATTARKNCAEKIIAKILCKEIFVEEMLYGNLLLLTPSSSHGQVNVSVTEANCPVTSANNRVTKENNKVTSVNNPVIQENQVTSVNTPVTQENNQVTSTNNPVTQENNKVTSVNNRVTKENNQVTSANKAVIQENNQVTSVNKPVTSANNQVTSTNKPVISANNRPSFTGALGRMQLEYPKIPETNIGSKMLRSMGWVGGGLGREGNEGIEEPVVVNAVHSRQGLGMEATCEISAHTNNPANKHRKNPSSTSKPEHFKKHRRNPIITRKFMRTFAKSSDEKIFVSDELIPEDYRLLEKYSKPLCLEYAFEGPSQRLVIRKPSNWASTIAGKRKQRKHLVMGKNHDRVSLKNTVQNFIMDNYKKEFRFSSDLSNIDRAIVHRICEKHGLCHKSFGTGDDRYLVISKP